MIFLSGLYQTPRTDDVVLNGFDDMPFHHWNGFVSRGMVDGLDGMRPDHFLDAGQVPNIANHRDNLQVRIFMVEFLFDFEKFTLCLVQYDQFFGSESRGLPAQL